MSNSSFFNWQAAVSAEPILKHSALVRSIHLTLKYCRDENGLELTQTGRLKRKYVDPLVRSFEWPHYNIEDFYAVSKVMNADDFPPIILVHDLLRHQKLVHHYKGRMKLTKTGNNFCNDTPALFQMIIPAYLFEVDHMAFSRMGEQPLGNWDIWLNVLNVAADHSARLDRLYSELYGPTQDIAHYQSRRDLYGFYNGVIEPLIWAGLLSEQRAANEGTETRLISKTPIWRSLKPL
jgi:hypothetical protein